jgi:diguanylate cyclase (GGDEF)-like protein
LHDIGKVAIPDAVLLKPDRLNDAEMAIMKTHAGIGAQTLDASLQRFPNVQFLQMARDIAMSHHERWDGTGYPNKLSGRDIPLAARIVALADVYDALTSRRIYREALSHAQAKLLIVSERGTQFDPDVVDAFLHLEAHFIAIKERFRDDERRVSSDIPAPVTPEPTYTATKAEMVLIADDDSVVRDLLSNFLKSRGIDCVVAGNGLEALAMFERHRPKLVISDWSMPELDGLELCRRIRAQSGGGHVHFIMLTMHSDEAELSKAFDAGVDDFLAKPFNATAMLTRLRAGLRAVALYGEISDRHQGSRRLNEQLNDLNQRLERLAITDDLTGLYNRRQAMHRLEEHWALCDRYQRSVAIVTIDIDNFKMINDRYGHSAGDFVLRGVAEAMRLSVRTTDTVCRIGGEEFLVILPCQTTREAELCAQRCRSTVEAQEFHYNGEVIRATISAGVAGRKPDMLQTTDLLKEADNALYAAKHAGRNRICIARSEAPEAGSSRAA